MFINVHFFGRVFRGLSFVKKIHAMSFVFDFSHEILFLFDLSIFSCCGILFLKTSSNMRFQVKVVVSREI